MIRPLPYFLVVTLSLLYSGCAQVQPTDTQPVADAPTGVKRAVLIGIDDYLANPAISDLKGAGNDVDLVRSVLVGKFEFEPDQVLVLKDSQATHDNILNTIRDHLGQSQPGDIALVHYSGHGSQMRDADGDEPDRMDETIVPHDSRQGGVFDISDDQINDLMSEISAKTEHVVFILDSCHSGTAARAAAAQGMGPTARFAPPDQRPPPPITGGARAGGTRGLEGIDDFRLPGAGYVLISGCRANELSNEANFGNARHGALTWFLVHALRSVGVQATYRDVIEQAQAEVTARFANQHPQIEGTGMDTAVFGVERLLAQPYMLVDPAAGGRAVVGAGEVLGLAVGAEQAVYPPGTRVFDGSVPPSARIRLTKVEQFRSGAEVISGSIAPGSRSVVDQVRSPGYRLGVFLAMDDGPRQTSLRTRLTPYDAIDLDVARSDADLVAVASGEADERMLSLYDRNQAALASLSLQAPDALQAAEDTITHWARWHAVLSLRNPSPDLAFDLQISRVVADRVTPVAESVPAGAKVQVSLTNQSSQTVFPILLDLTDQGRVSVIHPTAGLPSPIPAGQSLELRFDAGVREGRQSATDYIKAIVTTQQIAADAFRLEPLSRDVPLPGSADQSELARFLAQYATGKSRDLTPIAVTGWATRTRRLVVTRSTVRNDGFAAIFASEADASGSVTRMTRSAGRSVCAATAGNCEVAEFLNDPLMRVIRPAAVRAGNRSLDSVGAAFDQAYDIRDDTGAVRVEPLLELELPESSSAPVAGDPGTRGLGSDEPIARARDDDTWSLKYARVPEAWSALRAAGKPNGAEARGVVIAHLDTGYLEHDEIWGTPDTRPLWPEKGYDYHDEDHAPVDEKSDDWLDNPVHGTGSSSAIISPAGCQLAGVTQCPTGVAQGARLVPLRVNSSVVTFSTGRMAQALLDASGSDRDRVKVETDLASIAMGGPPSWTLWRAVKKAESRGFLIVAAAGNYVRTVVWPARFDSVIAVAAVNAECKPWVHSSRGRKVDIAAPGESVWRATMAGDNHDQKITGMGTGTTYGTATTSGVVALWVARHKGSDKYQELKEDGDLTHTLRSLLAQTSWRPGEPGVPDEAECADDAEWNSRRYGAGIVDARALLEADLESAAARGEQAVSEDQLPLWWSLYGAGDSLALAQDDYLRMFPGQPALQSVAYLEAEVMHHYATDEPLAELIDTAVSGQRSDGQFALIRQRLSELDTSGRLRSALVAQ